MADKPRKYNYLWEKNAEFAGWIAKSECGMALCKTCNNKIRPHKADLIRHAKTPKHVKSCSVIQRQKPLEACGFNSSNVIEEKKIKEIKISCYIAVHSSIRSVDHLTDLLNEIHHPKSSDSLRFKLHRTKATAIIRKFIAPVILQDLLEDVSDSLFSLIIDESTDISNDKYLCVCIKYFSEKKNTIVTNFLALIFVTTTTSQDIFEALKGYLDSVNLNVTKLIGIGTDGASNLCGKNNSLYTLLKRENPNLILNKCICHSLHLCASKASETFSDDVDFLIKETFNWFSHSPLRKAKYKEIWNIINSEGNFLNLVPLSGTRWLVRFHAVDRILTQYLELQTFFSIAAQNERCYKAVILANIYKDKKNLILLKFLKPILKTINGLNLYFQKDAIDFCIAIEEIILTIRSLARRIFKDNFLLTCTNIFELNTGISDYSTHLDLNDINYGQEFLTELNNSNLNNSDRKQLQLKCKDFLLILVKEMIKRLPANIEVFEKIKMFSPRICLNRVSPKLAELPLFFVDKKYYSDLEQEYEKLLDIKWSEVFQNIPNDTLTFWEKVSQIKTASGKPMFENLSKCVFVLLSLPSSNAIVERAFSTLNSIKTKVRNKLLLETMNALIRIKFFCFCNKSCCTNFIPSTPMLNRMNARIYDECDTDETEELFRILND